MAERVGCAAAALRVPVLLRGQGLGDPRGSAAGAAARANPAPHPPPGPRWRTAGRKPTREERPPLRAFAPHLRPVPGLEGSDRELADQGVWPTRCAGSLHMVAAWSTEKPENH